MSKKTITNTPKIERRETKMTDTIKTIAGRALQPTLGDILVVSLIMWAGIGYAALSVF